eukprot:COSAG01_NODE_4496_length_4975_cov_17.773790_1_plen_40_part_00
MQAASVVVALHQFGVISGSIASEDALAAAAAAADAVVVD